MNQFTPEEIAVVDSHDDAEIRAGYDWCSEHSGHVTMVFAQKQQVSNNTTAQELAQRRSSTVETIHGVLPPLHGDVMLMWPGEEELGALNTRGRSGHRACLVGPTGDWLGAWAAEVDPARLTTKAVDIEPVELDPLPLEVCRHIARTTTSGQVLKKGHEKNTVVGLLKQLRAESVTIKPGDLVGIALAHGASADLAKELRRICAALNAGKTVQYDRRAIRPDAVKRMKDDLG